MAQAASALTWQLLRLTTWEPVAASLAHARHCILRLCSVNSLSSGPGTAYLNASFFVRACLWFA